MRHIQATVHVTREAKLALPVEVEVETADSLVVDGQRVYSLGFFSSKTLTHRDTGCLLEKLRYCFFAGNKSDSDAVLSPWTFRDKFLCEGAALRECSGGMSLKMVSRGKPASTISVRPKDNPMHSWALGIHGIGGRFTLGEVQAQQREARSLSPTEVAFDAECSAWRALLRDALQVGFDDWRQLERKHPAAWVSELLTPLP